MAIALDTSTYLWITNPWTTLTASHTCSWIDRILFVWCFTNSTDDIVSITYWWVSMTKINGAKSDRYTYLYYLIAPATWANNVVITASTAWWAISWIAISYTWASQTGQPDANSTNVVTATSITNTLTTVANNCWTVAVRHPNAWATATAWAWTTLRQNSATGITMWDSNWALWIWSTTLWISYGSSYNIAWVMASFKPSIASWNSWFFMFM